MNALQRYNHTILRKHIFSQRIITSLKVQSNGILRLEDIAWGEYWENRHLQPLLDKLFLSWSDWISSHFSHEKLTCYVYDYFRLLETGLAAFWTDEIDVRFLKKIVAFEVFGVCTVDAKNYAASLFNTRNPNYLLHKISNPLTFDDPKYLPIICLSEPDKLTERLFFHYRRIPIKLSCGTQLFVYPPVATNTHEYDCFNVIDNLFRVLTQKNDPWIKLRCNALAKSVFDDLITSLDKPKIKLMDLGCGSAKISTQLCAHAYSRTKCSFDVSLVDTIPSRTSIQRSFYSNTWAFDAIHYHRCDLSSWVADLRNKTATYDITLMLRVCDTLCLYHPESIPVAHILSAIPSQSDIANLQIPTSQQILDYPEKIVHSLCKIRTHHGTAYVQPALQDFFKALFRCCNYSINTEENKAIVMPVRSFSEDNLVMEDGVSIIERIMDKSQYLIIEDADVSLDLLRNHAKTRRLGHLEFENKKGHRCFQNSHCTLISHVNR